MNRSEEKTVGGLLFLGAASIGAAWWVFAKSVFRGLLASSPEEEQIPSFEEQMAATAAASNGQPCQDCPEPAPTTLSETKPDPVPSLPEEDRPAEPTPPRTDTATD